MKNQKRAKLYLINQSANLPYFSGHTRQYEIGIGLNKLDWDIEILCSDFNIFSRKYFSETIPTYKIKNNRRSEVDMVVYFSL